MRLVSAIVVLSAGLATPSYGEDYTWCYDSSGLEPLEAYCSNTEMLPSLAAGLDAARQAPDVGGERPNDQLLLNLSKSPEPDPDFDQVVIDNTDGAYGQSLHLWMDTTASTPALCDPGGLVPLLAITGAPDAGFLVTIRELTTGTAFCGEPVGPLVVATDVDVAAVGVRVVGGVGPVVDAQSSPGARTSSVSIIESRFEGIDGSAIIASGPVEVIASEVSGVQGTPGQPVIESLSDRVELIRSALFGNVSEGAPLVSAAQTIGVAGCVVAGNVVIDGDLIRGTADMLAIGSNAGVQRSELTRNVLLDGGEAFAANIIGRDPPAGGGQNTLCLPAGADGSRYHHRDAASWTGEPGAGALVRLDPQGVSAVDGVQLLKNVVAGNVTGPSGAILRVGPLASGEVQVSLLHNTIDAGESITIDLMGPQDTARLVAARNLHVSGVPTLQGVGWSRGEVTMEYILTDEAAPEALPWSDLTGVTRPAFFVDIEDPFEPSEIPTELSPCGNLTLTCSETTSACEDAGLLFYELQCLLDLGLHYAPSDDLIAAMAQDPPWTTAWLAPSNVGAAATPGVTGWTCGTLTPPWDRVFDDDWTYGDGDGYTVMTDCENEDPDRWGVVPTVDGFHESGCDESEGSCYTCPPGSEADDDDSSALDDDDSSALDDDDDDDDDDSSTEEGSRHGCVGCGFSWSCTDGVVPVIALLPLAFSRRRRI